MLIVNDTHRLLAGVVSLNEPCPYCSQPLQAYPLIMSDDTYTLAVKPACLLLTPASIHRSTKIKRPL